MAAVISPLVSKILGAGVMGTAGALLFNALIKFGADAAGVSYGIENAEPVTMRAVVTSLIVVGLVSSAAALALAKNPWSDRWFGGLALLGLVLSLVSPILLGEDAATIAVLVIHHLVGGALIALPLLRAITPQQLGSTL